MATGIAMQGLSAAIVLTAIEKITKMISDAEGKLDTQVDRAIEQALRKIPDKPESIKANYSDSYGIATGALGNASVAGNGHRKPTVPEMVNQAVVTFFEDYTQVIDKLFPGLLGAGQDADRFVRDALQSAVGVSYSELVDRTGADTVFALARKAAYQQERETFDAAATAGHRFAPGVSLNAVARLHAESTQKAAEAIAAAHAARLDQERSDKLRLVRAEIDQRMDRIKQMQSKVAEAFRLKMQARGLWINDQNAVLDASGRQSALSAQFQAQIAEAAQAAAARRHASVVSAYEVSDRAMDIGKLRLLNGQEIVDLLGSMIATLQNQIRASGTYSGSERDVTDWDSLLA